MNPACPKCHKIINQKDIFCPHCGLQLTKKNPISRAQKIKVYVLSFLLAPFGLYWFFKYNKENDPEKKMLAKIVLWITAVAVILMLTLGALSAKFYKNLMSDYADILVY